MATRYPVSSLAGDMISLRSAMDRLFNESYIPSHGAGGSTGMVPMDVYANGDEVVVLAAVPGMQVDDLNITIEKNVLTISGTLPDVSDSEDAKGATWYVHELPSGTFERSLQLPMELDANRAEATFDNGMLRLVLPKADAEKPKQIKVKVGGRAQISESSGSGQTE